MSEIIGHCDILEDAGHLVATENNGVIEYHYRSTPAPG
jgi:hypothetical protein